MRIVFKMVNSKSSFFNDNLKPSKIWYNLEVEI